MTIWTKTLLKAHGWEPLEKEKPKVFPKSPSLFTITRWTLEMRIIVIGPKFLYSGVEGIHCYWSHAQEGERQVQGYSEDWIEQKEEDCNWESEIEKVCGPKGWRWGGLPFLVVHSHPRSCHWIWGERSITLSQGVCTIWLRRLTPGRIVLLFETSSYSCSISTTRWTLSKALKGLGSQQGSQFRLTPFYILVPTYTSWEAQNNC